METHRRQDEVFESIERGEIIAEGVDTIFWKAKSHGRVEDVRDGVDVMQ